MPKPKRPRFGSMGVWPRVRAKKHVARVRSYKNNNKAKLLGFAGYKAGMTHTIIVGEQKGKRTHGQNTVTPVTIIECPPMKIAAVRLYKKKGTAQIVEKQLNFKVDKELGRKLPLPKKDATISKTNDLDKLNPDDYSNITVQIYTMPKLTSIKKTPELFEMEIGGSNKEKIDYIKENADKQILIKDVFQEGQVVDSHAITKGKGFQGAVKRFGIGLKASKSEKSRRTPGSLGGWKGQGHIMYRVAHAGQTGFHQRTQYNNQILKISDNPKEVNPKGGFINFGEVKSSYILIKGSIQGPKKRLITLTEPVRQKNVDKFSSESIKYINTESKQRR